MNLKLRKSTLLAALLTVSVSAHAADDQPMSENQTLSYSLGMMLGERVLSRFGEVDIDALMEGMEAQRSGGDTKVTMDEAAATLQAYEQQAQAKSVEEAKAKGVAFQAENAKRDGVMVTESGLQWEVITKAEGDKPTVDDTVTVHYVGTLIDGTEFDSSISRGQPASFPLTGVIPGWTEGLQLMEIGSKYRFVIPSELAYGERGAGQDIGAHETLVFEVELLEIKQ